MMFYNFLFFLILNSFLLTNRPMQKIMLLIINLIFIVFNISLWTKSSWFSIIFMILMASGLMILFMYMASTQKNKIKNFSFSYSIVNTFFITILMMKYMNTLDTNTKFLMMNNYLLNFFNFTIMNMIILILIIIMLIIMVIYMELIFNFKSPLRMKF